METTKNALSPYEEDFFYKLKNYINKPIYFYGSIQRSDYFPQMSDIDIDIFSDNEFSTMHMLQNYLNISKKAFKKNIYKINTINNSNTSNNRKQEFKLVPGYKTKYVDKTNKLNIEISIYNEKYKDDILCEHQSKFFMPFYITTLLILLKFFHYTLGILPIYYYSKYKKLLTNYLYDNNKSEFVILDLS